MCISDLYLEDLKALNVLFDNLNETFFENTLSKPVITLQHDRRGRALGWFTLWKAWKSGEEESYEINMSTNFLDRSPTDKATTMLHEMCHLFAAENNIQDCSRSGIWHNKQFKIIAESHGLDVQKTDKGGFNHTTLKPESLIKVEPMLAALKSLKRVEGSKLSGKKSSTRKYYCPLCGASVRATKQVNIMCVDCDCVMVCDKND